MEVAVPTHDPQISTYENMWKKNPIVVFKKIVLVFYICVFLNNETLCKKGCPAFSSHNQVATETVYVLVLVHSKLSRYVPSNQIIRKSVCNFKEHHY